MGEPVSIEMSAFDFVRKGLPDPMHFRVRPDEITPSQWQKLIDDEIFWIKNYLRTEMLGFRSQVDTLEHMKALRLFQNDARQMGASTIGAVRLMVSRAKLPEENPCSLLLDRNGHWVVCFTVDRDAWFERITDQCLLGILETGGWELGLDVLKSIDVMVEDSIAERQKRLNDCKTHCNAHVGLSLSRLNAWRR